MYFLILDAVPPRDEPEARGAFVSCWVKAPDADDAELLARRAIREHGWTPLDASEQRQVTRDDYLQSESLGYYDDADQDGACFVFHTYPPE